MSYDPSLQAAAATWNVASESLGSVSRRIHDGAPLDQLETRAAGYVKALFDLALDGNCPARGANIMEIGSGIGMIMEAMNKKLDMDGRAPSRIIGLDIAETMIAKAKERLGTDSTYHFVHYDGVNVPLPHGSLDMIYSVAALQHIPKPFVYNLFLECRRLLKPNGFISMHVPGWHAVNGQQASFPWRDEIGRQIRGETGHWYHFYSEDELRAVLKLSGFPSATVTPDEFGNIWFGVS